MRAISDLLKWSAYTLVLAASAFAIFTIIVEVPPPRRRRLLKPTVTFLFRRDAFF